MKNFVILAVILSFSLSCYGKEVDIFSCDRQHVLKQSSPGKLILKNNDEHDIILKIPHEIYGGSIDTHTSTFVVYGSPLNLNNDNPQLMVVSIYKSFAKPKLYMRRYLGGGIYGVNFSEDHQYVIADTRFGDFVANVRTRKTELRSPSESATIDVARCN
jgi:hypothetical protein